MKKKVSVTDNVNIALWYENIFVYTFSANIESKPITEEVHQEGKAI